MEQPLSTYNLLLFDCQMPGMDGPVVVSKVRERELRESVAGEVRSRVPVVLHSATFVDAMALLECGADAFIEKPFTVEKWRALLSKWFRF